MGIKVGNRQPQAPQRQTALATNVRVARPQQGPGNQPVRGMSPSIRVRRPDANAAPAQLRATPQRALIASNQQAVQQEIQKRAQAMQQGLGGGLPASVITNNCIACGTPVTPGVDRLTTREGAGPFCPSCWAHTWIPHTLRNIEGGPPCSMGVRFTDPEWRAIQKAIRETVIDIGGRTGRFPKSEEMDVVLGAFRFSQVCRTCGSDVAYTLDSNDIKIPGVNQPWPPGVAPPWARQRQ